jgi:hypothetical protein
MVRDSILEIAGIDRREKRYDKTIDPVEHGHLIFPNFKQTIPSRLDCSTQSGIFATHPLD